MPVQQVVDRKRQRSEWKARLNDVEGRLAKHILTAVQKQAHHDAQYVENFIQPVNLIYTHYFFASWFVFFVNFLYKTFYVLTSVFLYVQYVKPIERIYDIVFPSGSPIEPAFILYSLKVCTLFNVTLEILLILSLVAFNLSTFEGKLLRYTKWFGLSYVIACMDTLSLGISASLIYNSRGLASSLVGTLAQYTLSGGINAFDVLQHDFQCCGFGKKTDWLQDQLFEWKDPFSDNQHALLNRFEYRETCNTSTKVCTAPLSCCTDFNPFNYSSVGCVKSHVELANFVDFQTRLIEKFSKNTGAHASGCVDQISTPLVYWSIFQVVNIIISLITWILLTFNASLAISQGEGLGCVDAFTETVMPSHNLKVFKERDGWVPSSRSKFNLFPSKENEMGAFDDAIAAAGKGQHHYLMNPEDSDDSGPVDKKGYGFFNFDF